MTEVMDILRNLVVEHRAKAGRLPSVIRLGAGIHHELCREISTLAGFPSQVADTLGFMGVRVEKATAPGWWK